MDHVQSDIELQVDNPLKNAANLIEWNVDMKVTVSNVKKSKMFQRFHTIILFLLAIIFAVMLSHLRKEVRALQTQVQSLNINLLLLTSKYDKLNRSLNRAWIQRSERFLENRSLHDGKYMLRDNAYGTNNGNNIAIPKSFTKLENNEDNINDTNLRIERAILTLKKQNLTEEEIRSNRGKINDDNINDDYYSDVNLNMWREPRPLVATFVGAIPEQHITDTVYIGPWVKSSKNNTQYNLNKFHLVEDKKSIEVTAPGLYMISAQIFYFGEPTNYSYWILLSSEGKSTTQKLVKCSTASSTSATEVSCYTSVITPLQRGDRVHIQQQERDRLINMREGHSYIQLVLLSNTICKRHLR
ncbi:hypothetical protein WN48_06048 [Eufriesea mexicana]|nr:hypothetical protein WN48_06048 [Eufriesea mexicana]